ncbi:hypothetical protein Asp14428_35440 [Actinoplanes sp. NBRC 14428]|nr:hypothetical protein Asp14428_35440 [Actinoplanes sp. NBRC 14428]
MDWAFAWGEMPAKAAVAVAATAATARSAGRPMVRIEGMELFLPCHDAHRALRYASAGPGASVCITNKFMIVGNANLVKAVGCARTAFCRLIVRVALHGFRGIARLLTAGAGPSATSPQRGGICVSAPELVRRSPFFVDDGEAADFIRQMYTTTLSVRADPPRYAVLLLTHDTPVMGADRVRMSTRMRKASGAAALSALLAAGSGPTPATRVQPGWLGPVNAGRVGISSASPSGRVLRAALRLPG